jgi:hypothetical protein
VQAGGDSQALDPDQIIQIQEKGIHKVVTAVTEPRILTLAVQVVVVDITAVAVVDQELHLKEVVAVEVVVVMHILRIPIILHSLYQQLLKPGLQRTHKEEHQVMAAKAQEDKALMVKYTWRLSTKCTR